MRRSQHAMPFQDLHSAPPLLRLVSLICMVVMCSAASIGPVCEGDLHRKWSFHAGAPLSAPAVVNADGAVAVGTQDGYIHALSEQGAFLWSYTVEGGLLDGVHVGSGERFMAVSTTGKIYSLEASGAPHWVFSTNMTPGFGATDRERGIFFLSRGSGLFAVSSRAGFLWSVDLKEQPFGRPVVDEEGYLWFVTQNRLHRLKTPYFHKSWPVTPGVRVLSASQDTALLLQENTLIAVDAAGQERWRQQGVLAASLTVPGQQQVVVAKAQEVAWLGRDSGLPLKRVEVPELEASALTASPKAAFIGSQEGTISVVAPTGKRASCRISSSSLFGPRLDAKRSQLIVSAGNGDLAAVSIEGWL